VSEEENEKNEMVSLLLLHYFLN